MKYYTSTFHFANLSWKKESRLVLFFSGLNKYRKFSILAESINIFRYKLTLREKCPYLKFFWFVFSCIRTECGEIRSISPYSVQIRGDTDQINSEYGHFPRSGRNRDTTHVYQRTDCNSSENTLVYYLIFWIRKNDAGFWWKHIGYWFQMEKVIWFLLDE